MRQLFGDVTMGQWCHNQPTQLRPCLIRPKPDMDFKNRILKPWGCKQTECWIRIRFLENKFKSWIWSLSRCRYLSIVSVRILSKCHCVVSLPFYCEIVDCELLKQFVWSFHWHLPIAGGHLETMNPAAGLVSWFHEAGFGFRKSGLNTHNGFWNRFRFWSNQTEPKWPNHPLELIGAYVHLNTNNKESLPQRCRRSTNVHLCLIFCTYPYGSYLNGYHALICIAKNRHGVTITTHAIKRHFLIWMNTVRQPTKRRVSCVLTLKYTFICVCWWTRQRIHDTLIVVERYLRLMGDKTIPDSAEPRLESFYPAFVVGIDLPHQGVVDSYIR